MNISRSASKLIVAQGSRALLTFLFIVVFARMLDSADLGIYFLFEAAVALLVTSADLGISEALKKRLSEGTSVENGLPTAIVMVLLPVGFLLIILLVIRPPLQEYLGAPIVGWVALGLFTRVMSKLILAAIEGQLRVGEISGLLFGQTLLWTLGGGILLALGGGVTSVIVARIAGDGLIITWGMLKLLSSSMSAKTLQVSLPTVRSFFEYAKYAWVSSIGGVTYGWMDVAILGLFVTQSAIGAYEVAWRVTMLPMLVGSTISRTLFPQISSWDSKNAKERIEAIIPNAIVPTTAATIPALVGVFIFNEEILRYLFGQEYTIAAAALIILMAEKILQAVHSLLGRSLQAIDRPDAAARATVYAVAVNLVLNFALIPVFHLVGAAIATVASFAVNTLLHAWYLKSDIAISMPWKSIGWITVSALVMGAALSLGVQFRPVDGILSLLVGVLSAIFLYSGVLLLNPSLRRMALDQYKMVRA